MVSVRSPHERFELIAGNVLEMLKFRGYKVDLDLKEVKGTEDLKRVFHLKDSVEVDLPKDIFIFHSKGEGGTEIVRALIAEMKERKVNHAIFITSSKLTSVAESDLRTHKR